MINAFNAWASTDAAYATVCVIIVVLFVMLIGLGAEMVWEIKNGIK